MDVVGADEGQGHGKSLREDAVCERNFKVVDEKRKRTRSSKTETAGEHLELVDERGVKGDVLLDERFFVLLNDLETLIVGRLVDKETVKERKTL